MEKRATRAACDDCRQVNLKQVLRPGHFPAKIAFVANAA
jgi:hypothetical protein